MRNKWENSSPPKMACIACNSYLVAEDGYERFTGQQFERLPIYICLSCGAEWGPGIDAADDDQRQQQTD